MNRRFVPTKTHGVLDYLSVATLLTVPRILGWSAPLTNMLTGVAAGTLVYSLTTRYEFGAVKVLPMQAHLVLDGLSGAVVCAAPRFFADEPAAVKAMLRGYGVFALAASLTTKTTPDGSGFAAHATDMGDEVQST